MKIKDWAPEDRPREKLLEKGISSLTDAELIAILLGSGTKDETAVEVAKRILKNSDNNLNELGKLGVNDLIKEKGLGPARAITIIAALELGRRRKVSESNEKMVIKSSRDAFEIFQPLIGDLSHEEFWVVFLNRANKVIDKKKISQGGITGTVTDIRLIMKDAVNILASGIILCHNHPSGNNKPSDADIKITKKVKEAAQLFDINLLDHLIVADKNYLSFADEGLI
ncbi:MAG: DNA repair protein RadC [Bacteroidales bacterium]|nr:DNA repair protein RadC [Bacteroidales bacterium]